MFDRIAVVLRGHVRTWHQIKEYVFKDYSKLAKSVDYYFVTWDIPGLDEDRIIDSFKGQNLIKFLKVSTDKHYNGSQGPSWLCKCISNNFIYNDYDIVIETRPDIVPFMRVNNNFNYNGSLHIIWESLITADNTVSMGISDTFQIMSMNVFKIYCTRYQKATVMNNHTDLRDFYLENNISLNFLGNLCNPNISRPTHIDFLPSINDLIKSLKEWEERWHVWENLHKEMKINMLKEYNILPEDYSLTLVI
jgi:hypothetical protein